MGKHQGIKWLTAGIKRKLTNSEINRGYFYVSKDRELAESYQFIINKKNIGNKIIDQFGRIPLGKTYYKNIKNYETTLKLKNGIILIEIM